MPTDLPNLLTLSRIAAIPLIVALASLRVPGADAAACLVFALAGVTDWLDGKLARDLERASDLGRMLDPIADKLLVAATLMVLTGTGRLAGWSLYVAIVLLSREILVSGLREYLAGRGTAAGGTLPVTRLAKWKTGAQMGALGTLLAGDPGAAWLGLGWLPAGAIGLGLLLLATVLTVRTGWDYARVAWRAVARG